MMKIVFILAFLTLLFPPFSYAEIIQGNSSATVNIETHVTGQGSVATHVVTDVNGNTQTYNSTKSGSITITANDKDTTITAPSYVQATLSAMPEKTKLKEKMNIFRQFFINFQNFFKNLFHWL